MLPILADKIYKQIQRLEFFCYFVWREIQNISLKNSQQK